MFLPELVPLPWRILKAWERVSLNRPRWIKPRGTVSLRDDAVKTRLIALGDVALIRRGTNDLAQLDGVKNLLESADLRVANLEAVVTRQRPSASVSGAGLRAEPEVVSALTAAGLNVVNAANNHALDYGPDGLAESLELLGASGIDVCGIADESGDPVHVARAVNSIRVGFLGFCDEINAATSTGAPRPCLWSPRATAAIAAVRREADVLIVQMHWGYEFSLHPLLRHREQARRAVEAGAHAVICHHAHVPQGLEIWKGCPIVYGLGNGCMPISSYLIEGHPWVDRSLALELGLAGDGIATVRLHALRLTRDGSPVATGDDSLMSAVAQMSARLLDDAFLDRCERARLVYEAVRLVPTLRQAAAAGPRALDERVAQLELPRQQSLIEFLESEPESASLARELRAATAARQAGDLPAAVKAQALESALAEVRKLYRWRDALRARLP